MSVLLKLFSLDCLKVVGWEQIRVGVCWFTKHVIKRGWYRIWKGGTPDFKLETSAQGENSIRKAASGIVGSAVGLYLLCRCHVSKKKLHSKNMVFCIPSVPSPLGHLYIDVTLSSIRWGEVWCCFLARQYKQHWRCLKFLIWFSDIYTTHMYRYVPILFKAILLIHVIYVLILQPQFMWNIA